jgi:hypothetical protein
MSTNHDHTAVLATLTEHLTSYDLPHRIASTAVHREITGHSVTVQLDYRALPDLATALLAWADTLTEVTAEAWRVPSGCALHLSIRGQLADGSPVTVYGGLDHTTHMFGPYLNPGDHQALPLALLREWTDLGSIREAA